MPLQNFLVREAHQRMNESDNPDTVAMPVGQIVSRMNNVRTAKQVVYELVEGYIEASDRLNEMTEVD